MTTASEPSVADPRLAPLDRNAFNLAAAAFEMAADRASNDVRMRHYRIAGLLVRMRIVGSKLAEVLHSPFAHLSVPDNVEPALTIDVWHEAETGIQRPLPEQNSDTGLYGYMSVSENFRFVAEQRPQSIHWLDRQTNRAIVWISAVDRLCLDERARPFHRLLAMRLADSNVQFIHAGLVAWDGRGVLFIGKGGSGKSTCSISCALNGASYLGDDFIALESERGASFRGHSLYNTALISPNHMALYPVLAAACEPGNYPEEEKSVVGLGNLPGVRSAAKSEIRAIVLPRVVASATSTEFRRVSAHEALLALAPTSVLYLPSARPDAMERLGALVERVPSYRLNLGRDVSQIPERAREILAAG